MSPIGFAVPVARWCAWAPGLESEEAWHAWAAGRLAFGDKCVPELPQIPALLRRRLGNTARLALHVANVCAEGMSSVRTVFASRHGELKRTLEMLSDLARGDGVSPAAFGLSVHNASAGIFSIVRQDRSPVTAIAAGEESFGWGLVEAAAQWMVYPEEPILLVYADAPVPSALLPFADDTELSMALAILIEKKGETTLTFDWCDSDAVPPLREHQALSLLPCLLGRDCKADWFGERTHWHWSLDVRHA